MVQNRNKKIFDNHYWSSECSESYVIRNLDIRCMLIKIEFTCGEWKDFLDCPKFIKC